MSAADAIAFESLTISNTAKSLTANKIEPVANRKATEALITVEGASLRFRIDGSAPDVSTGHLVASGSSVTIEGYDNLKQFQAIRATGSDATIFVTYLRG